jgi:hypothetical protein
MEGSILFFICIIMKSKTIHFLSFLFPCLLACSIGHAYEQDNWYLANEWNSGSSSSGVAYYEDNTTGTKQIYVTNTSSDNIKVYDLNGSLARTITIASQRINPYDLCLDANGTIYIGERYAITCLDNDGTFRWRTGKNASISNAGSSGSGNGEFNYAMGITIGPDGNLYVADGSNTRIQVLDKSGSFLRKFGSSGTAPGQLKYNAYDVKSLSNGTLVVKDYSGLNYFDSNGTFIKRLHPTNGELEDGGLAISRSDEILTYANRNFNGDYANDVFVYNSNGDQIARFTNNGSSTRETSWRYCFTPNGDIIVSTGSKIRIYKRAFRTKGLPVPNVIPQPAIRSISQRAGTNILDLDFEIIDSDDATATVGILAYAEGTRILPQAWTDGTGSMIGVPIATNQVHRMSWDVKQDWTTNTGEIKFEILCQDASRSGYDFQDGLIAYYPFDGNASDHSGNGNHGSPVGTTLSSDRLGNPNMAFQFNGTNDYILLPQTQLLDGQTNATISIWFKFGSPYQAGQLLASGDSRAGLDPFSMRIAVGGAEDFGFANTNNTDTLKTGGLQIPGMIGGTWQQITAVVKNTGTTSTMKTFHNGQLAGSASSTTVFTIAYDMPMPAKIGTIEDAAQFWKGGMDELRVYDRALSDAEVLALYHHESNASSTAALAKPVDLHFLTLPLPDGNLTISRSPLKDSDFLNFFKYQVGTRSNEVAWDASTSSWTDGNSTVYMNTNNQVTADGRNYLMSKLGHRYATTAEVTKAKEAATPGSVNKWSASRPIQPRNLPAKVNEYGFDSNNYNSRAWWVVKE